MNFLNYLKLLKSFNLPQHNDSCKNVYACSSDDYDWWDGLTCAACITTCCALFISDPDVQEICVDTCKEFGCCPE